MNLWLLLLSHFAIALSLEHVFHFINESKSWCEARSHCRKHYSGLATVSDMEDLDRLKRAAQGRAAWIGLRNETGDREWHWSQPGVEFHESEAEGRWGGDTGKEEPNDNNGPENCVSLNSNNKWFTSDCGAKLCFICYNGVTGSSPTIIPTLANWTAAQHYCRERHTHLISGLDQLDQRDQERSDTSECYTNEKLLWTGLFRDTWGWSDGSNSSFRHWEQGDQHLTKGYVHDNKNCAKLGPQGQWIRDHCDHPHPFICYDKLIILVKENKTWEDAMDYCRHHHLDLAWFNTPNLQRMVQERAKMADSKFVWVGLHYKCLLGRWIWLSGHCVHGDDHNWKKPGYNDCGVNGAMERGGSNKWVKKPSENKYNFICAERR